MTQMMHNVIGYSLCVLTWFLLLKPYFVREEEVEFWYNKLSDRFDWF